MTRSLAHVACPCCGFLTLDARGDYEICHVCFWEDDGCDDPSDELQRGGPNGITLGEGRANYQDFGACVKEMLLKVRSPLPTELP